MNHVNQGFFYENVFYVNEADCKLERVRSWMNKLFYSILRKLPIITLTDLSE